MGDGEGGSRTTACTKRGGKLHPFMERWVSAKRLERESWAEGLGGREVKKEKKGEMEYFGAKETEPGT